MEKGQTLLFNELLKVEYVNFKYRHTCVLLSPASLAPALCVGGLVSRGQAGLCRSLASCSKGLGDSGRVCPVWQAAHRLLGVRYVGAIPGNGRVRNRRGGRGVLLYLTCMA